MYLFLTLNLFDLILFVRYLACKSKVHECLCDSVDTKSTLEAMRTVVGQCNVYIQDRKAAKQTPNRMLLQNIGMFLTKILKVRCYVKPVPQASLYWTDFLKT